MAEYISIKEFSRLADVTPQSIYRRLDSIDNVLSKYVKVIDNKKMLNIEALKDIYNVNIEENTKQHEQDVASVEQLKSMIETLTKQLEEKDLQIRELTKLLGQEQQLHLLEKQKLEQIETKLETPKRSFWSFFKSEE